MDFSSNPQPHFLNLSKPFTQCLGRVFGSHISRQFAYRNLIVMAIMSSLSKTARSIIIVVFIIRNVTLDTSGTT